MRCAHPALCIQAQEVVRHLDRLADGVADQRNQALLQLGEERMIVDDEASE
jgi:hypothetical protein